MKKIYILVFQICLLFGCTADKKPAENPDSDCILVVVAPVSKVDVSTTAQVSQNIPVDITYWITNGCGGFLKFDETNEGNSKTIKVMAKYGGCVCTLPVFELHAVYNFVPTSAGIYTIKVDKGDGTFFSNEITVN
jgi:hypothetical protein